MHFIKYIFGRKICTEQLNVWINGLTGYTLLAFRRLEEKDSKLSRQLTQRSFLGQSRDLSTSFQRRHGSCNFYILITTRKCAGYLHIKNDPNIVSIGSVIYMMYILEKYLHFRLYITESIEWQYPINWTTNTEPGSPILCMLSIQ
jgi:hypothetical protein